MPFDVLRGCGMGRVSEGPIYSPAMFPLLRPVQMLLLMFAGWVNRHQLDVIEYLQEENRVLKERMGGRRLRFTDRQSCGAIIAQRLDPLRSYCWTIPGRSLVATVTRVLPRHARFH